MEVFHRETFFAHLRPNRYFRSIPSYRTILETTVMEDTQKLTHLAFTEEHEAELLEDFFRNRDWSSDKQLRFNKMREKNFVKPEVSRAA